MEISYKINPKDHRDFILHLSERICQNTGLKKKVFIALVILPQLNYIERKFPSNFVNIGIIIVFVGFCIDIMLSFFRARRLGRYLLTESHGITCGEHELECRGRLIIERTPQYEIRRPWNQVASVEEGLNHVGLIMKTPPCVWIPKQALATQEEQAAFLQHARTSMTSAAEESPTSTRPHYSRQQFSQGLQYIWKKQFWVIPVLLSLLGIAMYHYHETNRTPAEASSGFTERQDNEGQSYFEILPENENQGYFIVPPKNTSDGNEGKDFQHTKE